MIATGYDDFKSTDPDLEAADLPGFDDCHEHDDTCPEFCEQATYEDLVERARDDAAERRAEDAAHDAYWAEA